MMPGALALMTVFVILLYITYVHLHRICLSYCPYHHHYYYYIYIQAVLWLSKPYEWSPAAVFAATRVFASNLHAKMAQVVYNYMIVQYMPSIYDNTYMITCIYMLCYLSIYLSVCSGFTPSCCFPR
jgi:hypothetical protein